MMPRLPNRPKDPTSLRMERTLILIKPDALQRGLVETFTACRVNLGDNNSDEDRDWYRPFLHAQCVFSESLFRQDLELGPAPGIRDETLVPVIYSTFMNIVLSGDRFPDLAWREQFKKDIEDGSLLPPFPADLKSQSAETAF